MPETMSKKETESGYQKPTSERIVKEILTQCDIIHKDLNYAVNDDPDDIPYLVLDHEMYCGVEAHLFTGADIALWIPELLPSGDVVIYFPIRKLKENKLTLSQRRLVAWDILLHDLNWVMEKAQEGRVKYGEPSEIWAHTEREEDGYFEIPENEPIPIDKIIRCVDTSIVEVILELNRNGFATVSSCSGLEQDHDGVRPFNPYVTFDDEYYHDVSAHLFTLGEAAGWDPSFGAHGFDVFLDCVEHGDTAVLEAWNRLG